MQSWGGVSGYLGRLALMWQALDSYSCFCCQAASKQRNLSLTPSCMVILQYCTTQ
jgi:hypothetical protein